MADAQEISINHQSIFVYSLHAGIQLSALLVLLDSSVYGFRVVSIVKPALAC